MLKWEGVSFVVSRFSVPVRILLCIFGSGDLVSFSGDGTGDGLCVRFRGCFSFAPFRFVA